MFTFGLLEETEVGSAEEQPARDIPTREAYNPVIGVHLLSDFFIYAFLPFLKKLIRSFEPPFSYNSFSNVFLIPLLFGVLRLA